MSDPKTKAMAFRLPIDLANAIEARATSEGISPSEVMRNIFHAWFYGEVPSANEGYYQARGNSVRLARMLLTQALDALPTSDEEAQDQLAGFEATRRSR